MVTAPIGVTPTAGHVATIEAAVAAAGPVATGFTTAPIEVTTTVDLGIVVE